MKTKTKKQKKALRKKYYKKNRWKFWILDLMVIGIILLNCGALVTTNVLVMKEGADKGEVINFTEANPVAAKVHNFKPSPGITWIPPIANLFKQAIWWTIIFGLYLLRRNTIYRDEDYNVFFIAIVFLASAITLDFLNNLGYLIGKIIFY